MPTYLLRLAHDATACAAAFAAWKGFESPLRGRSALCGCEVGDHVVWWRIEAEDADAALRQVPPFVRRRAELALVRRVETP